MVDMGDDTEITDVIEFQGRLIDGRDLRMSSESSDPRAVSVAKSYGVGRFDEDEDEDEDDAGVARGAGIGGGGAMRGGSVRGDSLRG